MSLIRYVVLSTANWKNSTDPLLANVHGIYESLDTANSTAKTILSKEIGAYKIDYDKDGCLIMDDKEDDDGLPWRTYETTKKAPTKKELFRVRVVKHRVSKDNGTNEKASTANAASAAPPTFTQKIELYYFTRVYQHINGGGEIEKEKFQEGKYFLGKRAALEYFHATRYKHDFRYRNETVEEFVEYNLDTERWDMPEHFIDTNWLHGPYLSFRDVSFIAIFRTDGKQAKKGYMETTKSQIKVEDWDGTEKGYNKLFPDSPLRIIEAPAPNSNVQESVPTLLSKTIGGGITKKKAVAKKK